MPSAHTIILSWLCVCLIVKFFCSDLFIYREHIFAPGECVNECVDTATHGTVSVYMGVFSHVWWPVPPPPLLLLPRPLGAQCGRMRSSRSCSLCNGPLSPSVSKYLLSTKSRRDSTEKSCCLLGLGIDESHCAM